MGVPSCYFIKPVYCITSIWLYFVSPGFFSDLLTSEGLLANLPVPQLGIHCDGTDACDEPELPASLAGRRNSLSSGYSWNATGAPGRPYFWAQRLAGLPCLPCLGDEVKSNIGRSSQLSGLAERRSGPRPHKSLHCFRNTASMDNKVSHIAGVPIGLEVDNAWKVGDTRQTVDVQGTMDRENQKQEDEGSSIQAAEVEEDEYEDEVEMEDDELEGDQDDDYNAGGHGGTSKRLCRRRDRLSKGRSCMDNEVLDTSTSCRFGRAQGLVTCLQARLEARIELVTEVRLPFVLRRVGCFIE
ncbi:unnamed protein product [Protopolystoma xenopodis]|uniref:Uncharacterized protein n=1 Tax=Protopolystoma xenopodis TaxID=117903 RepID=A0A3S5FC13_9PLAT|nr:unnamed protein product [Protopolystoma xenopodis]